MAASRPIPVHPARAEARVVLCAAAGSSRRPGRRGIQVTTTWR